MWYFYTITHIPSNERVISVIGISSQQLLSNYHYHFHSHGCTTNVFDLCHNPINTIGINTPNIINGNIITIQVNSQQPSVPVLAIEQFATFKQAQL